MAKMDRNKKKKNAAIERNRCEGPSISEKCTRENPMVAANREHQASIPKEQEKKKRRIRLPPPPRRRLPRRSFHSLDTRNRRTLRLPPEFGSETCTTSPARE